jgi:hypothetical protein
MANTPVRRFVELNVDEVSLVDSPANEEEFAVIKSLTAQEDDMADDKSKEAGTEEETTEESEPKTEEETTDDGAEKVEVEADKPDDEGVAKAMAQVVSLVEGIAKAAGADAASEEENDDAEEEETEKGAMFGASGIRELMEKTLKKAGMKGDALKAAMDEFDKATKKVFMPGAVPSPKIPPSKKPKKPGEAPVYAEKSADADADDVAEEEMEDEVAKTLDVIEGAIQKAKRFTPKREEALKTVVAQLSTLLKELTGSSKATLPGGTQFGASGISDLTVAVKKLAEAFGKHSEESAATTKALQEKVETIEKERQPSTSIDGDDTDKEEETEKSFWQGLL